MGRVYDSIFANSGFRIVDLGFSAQGLETLILGIRLVGWLIEGFTSKTSFSACALRRTKVAYERFRDSVCQKVTVKRGSYAVARRGGARALA
jgi:hypothetical protein